MGSIKNWRLAETEKLVLAVAAELGGVEAAQAWYEIPLLDMDGWTPRQLVEHGRAQEVFEYLTMLEADIPYWERPIKTNVTSTRRYLN
jgi:hypothetical protein